MTDRGPERATKRIVICADGTWNDPEDEHPTNVLRMARAIRPQDGNGVQQVVFYDWGVGSYYARIRGGVAGLGPKKNIQDCYRFIVQNYDEGDELLLFGFSRGAYTVRALGVPTRVLAFVDEPDLFYDDELGSSVRVARHAVAIDERREDFEPTLWCEKADAKARDPLATGSKDRKEWNLKPLPTFATRRELGSTGMAAGLFGFGCGSICPGPVIYLRRETPRRVRAAGEQAA